MRQFIESDDITDALNDNKESLPRNPQSASQHQAKIAMLQNTSLAMDIVNDRRWVEGQATSINGRVLPIVVVFPLESMRAEATVAARTLESVMPPLERFYDIPLPASVIRVWYGFVIGNSGGGGTLYMEDRTTSEGRTGPTRLPYDAILYHELGHSYMGHESLNQFLEVYLYNVVRTGSIDLNSWSFVRDWVPGSASNSGVAALIDVYQLIGFDVMTRAYRAIHPLKPAYGAPLAATVIPTFVAQVPAALQAQVGDKLAKVGF